MGCPRYKKVVAYALIPVRSYCSPPPDCKRYVVISMLPSGWLVSLRDGTMLS